MTQNKRIFLNVVATYGRSVYALVVGLFCGRWALMALGEIDYGLYGLIGGLTYFLTFINIALSGPISRFYAFSIGAVDAALDKCAAIEECRRWFNIALMIHTLIPLLLVCVGYPLGSYAVSHWLTVPKDRIMDCLCVWKCVIASCFFGMLSVPFVAMYNAKQYIAELTVYGFATSTLNMIVLYYMVNNPAVWLSYYAIFSCILATVPQLIICIRAFKLFPECRVKLTYMMDLKRISKIGAFAGWHMYGMLCSMLRTQGISVVINKFFGATMNAAQTIGNNVQGHCTTLAGAMQGAFMPVITQACGAKEYAKMNKFALRTCKFNIVFSVVFMIPLGLELPAVLKLWLGSPPAYSVGLCYFAMAMYLAGCSTMGHIIVVNAVGKIALFHAVLYSIDIFTVPVAVLVGVITHDVYYVMTSVVVIMSVNSIGRVFFAKAYAHTSITDWVCGIILPAASVSLICLLFGLLPRFLLTESLARICLTTIVVEALYLPLCWFLIFSQDEREFVLDHNPFRRFLKRD